MIRSGFQMADSEEEKLAVSRFRYDVYVEEMGRYEAAADHENRTLMEPEDDTARHPGVVASRNCRRWSRRAFTV